MIEVVDADPAWPAAFDSLRARYEKALAGVAVIAIEHVGSTSVPGLAAKPVIDIDIVVARPDVGAAIAAMEADGFECRGDLGIADRWSLREPAGLPRTNTYVVVDGSLPLRNHLGVREVLRRDADLRARYGQLKRRLASELDDIDRYVDGKTALIAEILEAAGLTAHERAAIAAANRVR